jgi:hypothetical protein
VVYALLEDALVNYVVPGALPGSNKGDHPTKGFSGGSENGRSGPGVLTCARLVGNSRAFFSFRVSLWSKTQLPVAVSALYLKKAKSASNLAAAPACPSVGILPATASAFGAGMLPATASAFAARLGGVRMALKGCGGRHATLRKMRNQGAVPAAVVMPARSAAPLNSRPEMPRSHATEGQDLIAEPIYSKGEESLHPKVRTHYGKL